MDILRWLDLDSHTLALLIGGGVVLLVVIVLSVRSLLTSRLVVIVGGLLALGTIAPGVLGAVGNLLGGLLSGLLPLIVLVLGGVFGLLVFLNRNPELREWLKPLLPDRPSISALPPTHVETPATRYIIEAARQPPAALPPAPAARSATPVRRRRHPYLPDWED